MKVQPRTVGVSPAQLASLRALPKRLMSPISATMTSAVNSPTPGSVVRVPDSRVGSGVLAQLVVDSVGQRRQAVDDRQAVGHDIAGDGGQSSPASQPRPGPDR